MTSPLVDPNEDYYREYLTHVWVLSNERNQEETQETLNFEPMHGNAVWGCSGWNILNLASLRPEIEYISVFDLSERVQDFWNKTCEIFSSRDLHTDDPAKNYQNAKIRFSQAAIGAYYVNHLNEEIEAQLSFLSTRERFERVQKIFQNHRFNFKRLNFGIPEDVQGFVDEQTRAGIVPFLVYISNIPTACIRIGETLESYQRLLDSVSRLPQNAIIIDAVKKKTDQVAAQRLTPPPDKPKISPSYEMVLKALYRYDTTALDFYFEHGADLDAQNAEGQTYLMLMAENGNLLAVQWLMAHGSDPASLDPDKNSAANYCERATLRQELKEEILYALEHPYKM